MLCVVSVIRGCVTRAATQPTKRKSKAWFTSKHYELHRNVKTAFKRYRDNPILTNAEILAAAKNNFTRECRWGKNIPVEHTEKGIVRIAENDKSQLWKILTAKESEMVTCQVTQTELENHFKTIYFRQNTPSWSLNSIKVTDYDYKLTRIEDFNLILDVEITPTEIVTTFQSLKRRKAIGIDRTSGDGIKVNFGLLWHCFLYTFNKFFESAACPTEWKTAIVTPIYEGKGSRSDPGNYRRISILPAMYKVYSKILHA